jgi:CheY-like chemotaxis protein
MRLEDNVHRPARGPTRQSFGVKADRPIPPHFFADVNQEDYKVTIQHNPATDLSPNKRSSPPLVSTRNGIDRVRPVLSPDFEAWRLEKLIESIENVLTAVPLPKSLFGTPPSHSRLGILVVDDDTYNFDLLENAFDSDYEVLFATNGMKAIQIATQNVPDLILLDVMMPHMDGYEACRRLKAERRTGSIPIMFVTGLGDICSETKGLELGAVDYITKPINVTAVRARVNIQIQLKWALDRLVQAAALEKALRGDILKALQLKSHGDPVH